MRPLRILRPSVSILNRAFRYVSAAQTDLRKKFDEERERLKAKSGEVVVPINRKEHR
ncbi:MAG: hypothetical protein ACRD3M_18720 [Thermoanaerobaculia bacterium]